ncbi:MAG: hypothetical protein HYW38_00710 [Candidatus Colwellbacteria bacterium]|nr:hypothetical protein [Candidatus Colwellbacteria bacterium]
MMTDDSTIKVNLVEDVAEEIVDNQEASEITLAVVRADLSDYDRVTNLFSLIMSMESEKGGTFDEAIPSLLFEAVFRLGFRTGADLKERHPQLLSKMRF